MVRPPQHPELNQNGNSSVNSWRSRKLDLQREGLSDLLRGRRLHPSSVHQHLIEQRLLLAPPPTPSPILGRDLLQPWEQSFPSAPALWEFWIFGENQETGIWSFLLHSRNKNVASTKPNGARFFWRGLLRLSGSRRANDNLFHNWSISPIVASLVCVGGAGRGPSRGGTPRVRPSQGAQSSSSEVPGCDLPQPTAPSRTPAPLCKVTYSFASS